MLTPARRPAAECGQQTLRATTQTVDLLREVLADIAFLGSANADATADSTDIQLSCWLTRAASAAMAAGAAPTSVDATYRQPRAHVPPP